MINAWLSGSICLLIAPFKTQFEISPAPFSFSDPITQLQEQDIIWQHQLILIDLLLPLAGKRKVGNIFAAATSIVLALEGSNKLIIIDNNNKRIFQSNSGQKFNFDKIHFRNTTKRQHPCLLNHGFSMRWPPLRVIGFWHSKVQRGGRTCNLLDDLDLQQKVINPCNNICSSQGVASFKKLTTLIHKKQAVMKRVYFFILQ